MAIPPPEVTVKLLNARTFDAESLPTAPKNLIRPAVPALSATLLNPETELLRVFLNVMSAPEVKAPAFVESKVNVG